MPDWREHVRAIDASPALRVYAVLLSLLHALTGAAWFAYKHVASLTTADDAACWPLFPNCHAWRAHLTPDGVTRAVWLYMALGVFAGALFVSRKPRAAIATFLAATVLGAAIYALDYRLRFNQTYMLSWTVLALLFAPPKKKLHVLQILVALFYFWAGTLKLNREWTSGAALYAKPLFVPESLVPASCVYVLVLELAMVWLLFSPRAWMRWAAYAQLVLFHVVSFGVVGWFYPLLMFAIGAIYPLTWKLEPGETLTPRALLRDSRVVGGAVAMFSIFQLVPHAFPGDTAVTGEGRLFALHMFDAKVDCRASAIVTTTSGAHMRADLVNEAIDTRTRCDPLELLANASLLCRSLEKRQDVSRVDVSADAKRATDDRFAPLFRLGDYCKSPPSYSIWHHNAWLSSSSK